MTKNEAFAEADRINGTGLWQAEPIPNGDGTFAVRLTTRTILGVQQYRTTVDTVQNARYYRRYETPQRPPQKAQSKPAGQPRTRGDAAATLAVWLVLAAIVVVPLVWLIVSGAAL